MQKIIKLSSHGTTNSGNDPVRVLKTLRELHDQMAKAVESCVMMAEEFLPELAEMIDMDASEFFMRAGDLEEFDYCLQQGSVTPLFFYATRGDTEYTITIIPPDPDDEDPNVAYIIEKYENKAFHVYDPVNEIWKFDHAYKVSDKMESLMNSNSPEADIITDIVYAYDGNMDEKKYQSIKSKHKGLFDLYNQVHQYMDPFYELDENGVKGKLYLEPKDPLRLGFRVGWNGSEYILYQYLNLDDFLDDYFYSDGNKPEIYSREVGRTPNIGKIKNFLWKAANRYLEKEYYTIPLSLNAFTEASNIRHLGRRPYFIDVRHRKLTDKEKASLESVKAYTQDLRKSQW